MMGAIAMAFWVAGLFFLRFWWDTRDRLFAIFGLAFWLLGATRVALAFARHTDEEHSYLYWVRLVAFLLILAAIADKNRPQKNAPALGDEVT